ncbi:Mitochondrial biogenesis protein AIM24 [Lasallia pustulata]|uniref:Mitochondrial biogenesis protein AIM24 n=1 Tax=Lasallia pustulata TaxID=136370 RepID=A0A1W5D208_9LECA|nr:Mitochondrial biogenesis protein AIM24 [Lasallia pustulata]
MRHTLLRTAELTKGYIRGVLPRTQWHRTLGRRCVQISATPSDASPALDNLTPAPPSSPADSPDARFEVLGAPYSLLSVSLSASQNLYTRRGTLVGISGKAENAVSSLSMLEPIRRLVLGIPFLYQRPNNKSKTESGALGKLSGHRQGSTCLGG